MKAITVRQPWAWAIIHGGKDIENRTRNIAGGYRGPVVIHAAKRYDGEHEEGFLNLLTLIGFDWGAIPDGFILGNALGIAHLVDVHPSRDCYSGYTDRYCSDWAEPDSHHLALANPRPFPEPIPYRGQLGLWTFPDELLPEVSW